MLGLVFNLRNLRKKIYFAATKKDKCFAQITQINVGWLWGLKDSRIAPRSCGHLAVMKMF